MRTIVALMMAFSVPATAQNTRTQDRAVAPPAADIAQLAWLAGNWRGEGLGGQSTAIYSAPEAGQISGHFIQARAGRVAVYELMQIVPVGASLSYRLRHFHPDLTVWEDEKQGKVVAFPLIAIEKDAAYFEGLTLRRTGADTMDVFVRIGGEWGPHEERFRYRRGAP